jgi:hypothetical protein
VSKRPTLTKVVDERGWVVCKSDVRGQRREEVWVDENGKVGRYNLALILPTSTIDHGRVLGYDNAHGAPERHLMGDVELAPVEDYEVT